MAQTRKRVAANAALEEAALDWRAPPAADATTDRDENEAPTETAFARILKTLRQDTPIDAVEAPPTEVATTNGASSSSSAAPACVISEARRIMKRARDCNAYASTPASFPRLRAPSSSHDESSNDESEFSYAN